MSVAPVSSPAVSLVLVRALAVVVAGHGVAHFVGTSRSLAKAADGGSVDYLGGAWTISDPALLRTLAVLWALAGAAVLGAAVVVWMLRPGWPVVLGAVSLASLLLVAAALWSSAIGLAVDVALLAVVIGIAMRRRPHLARR